MIAVIACLPALLAFALVGAALDRALALGLARTGLARGPLYAFAGLAALFLAMLHPLALALALALALPARWRARTTASPPAPHDPVTRSALVVLALFACIALARPSTPLYWDEFVWLWKSRLEANAFGSLRAAALDPRGELYPPGYPLLWSLAPAWLSAPFHRTPLTTASTLVTLGALTTWLASLRHALRDTGRAARPALFSGAALLLATPLLLVHLRTSYADLTVGLLASSIALYLAAPREGTVVIPWAAPALLALILAGLKDEGLLHTVAAVLVALVIAARKRAPREALGPLVVAAAALVPFVTWRVLTAMHGVVNTDHAVGTFRAETLPLLLRAFGVHATDAMSWGALWPAVLGAMAATAFAKGGALARARVIAATLVVQWAGLTLGIACGSGRLREFALGGSLIGRVLVQLAPAGIALVAVAAAEAWRARAEAPGSR